MEDKKACFVELTDKALPEEDVAKLIEYLCEREPYKECLMDSFLRFSKEEAQILLKKETKLLERLTEKRARLLKEAESISVLHPVGSSSCPPRYS